MFRADIATQEGCQNCSAHMGRNIGCEYTKRCDCLEYAAVDEARLTSAEMIVYQQGLREGGSTMGLPKKFPYYCEGTKYRRSGTLVPFYLDSRRPIYECNDNCKCGRFCRNKVTNRHFDVHAITKLVSRMSNSVVRSKWRSSKQMTTAAGVFVVKRICIWV